MSSVLFLLAALAALAAPVGAAGVAPKQEPPAAPASASAPAPEELTWDTAGNQLELNAMAGKDCSAAEREMDKQLTRVLDLAKSDPRQVERVRRAQTAWEAYRDAQMEALYGCGSGYGSVMPMCYSMDRQSLVTTRTADLRAMADSNQPEQEGDVCAWNPVCEP